MLHAVLPLTLALLAGCELAPDGDDEDSENKAMRPVYGISIAADGETVASFRNTPVIEVRAPDGTVTSLRLGDTYPRWVQFHPSLREVLAAYTDGRVVLWDLSGESPKERLVGRMGADVCACDYSPGGRRVVIADTAGRIAIWDVRSSSPPVKLYHDGLQCVAWSPDGKRLASGGGDRRIRIWDAASGRPLQQLTGHVDIIRSVQFSPTEATLISASMDGTVRLWDLSAGRERWQINPGLEAQERSRPVRFARFSPDGSAFATSVLFRGKVWLWDAHKRELLATFEAHGETVSDGHFTRRGRLYTAGYDGLVNAFDVQELLPAAASAPQPTAVPRGTVPISRRDVGGDL